LQFVGTTKIYTTIFAYGTTLMLKVYWFQVIFGKELDFRFGEKWFIFLNMSVGKGGRGGLAPLYFEIFSRKRLFS